MNIKINTQLAVIENK